MNVKAVIRWTTLSHERRDPFAPKFTPQELKAAFSNSIYKLRYAINRGLESPVVKVGDDIPTHTHITVINAQVKGLNTITAAQRVRGVRICHVDVSTTAAMIPIIHHAAPQHSCGG